MIGKLGYRRHEWHRYPGGYGKRITFEVVREAVDPAVGGLVALLENGSPSPGMDDIPPGEFSRFVIYLAGVRG